MEYKEYEKLNYDLQYKQKGYPKKLWPILNEYFSRFKYEYELSDSEINERLERMISNLDKIKIGYFGESLSVDGVYNYYEKNIKIKMESTKNEKMSLGFIDSIFHELNHVTDMSSHRDPKTKKGKIFSYDFLKFDEKNESRYGICLNEVITELKSKRLFYNEKNNDAKLSDEKIELGYPDILFIGSMIHTTLGISEREFLKHACKGREKFDEIMREKFDDDTYDNFINSFYHYSDIMCSKVECTNEIDKIKELCLNAMEKRMQCEKKTFKDKDSLKQFAVKCKTELENLNKYYNEGKKDLKDETIELNQNQNYEILYKVFGNELDFSNIEQNNTVITEESKQWDNTELQESAKNVDKKNYLFSRMIGKYKKIRQYIWKKEDEVIQKLIPKWRKTIGLPESKEIDTKEQKFYEELKEQVKNEKEISGDNTKENLERFNKEIEYEINEK